MLRTILALLVVVAVPAVSRAQSPVQANTWSVSPLLGIAFPSDGDASLAIAGVVDYHLTPVLAFEGELGHVFDTASDNADIDASLTTAHASILYIFDSDFAIRPYLAAGLGAGHYSVTLRTPPADFDTTEIGFNLGGGVIYPLDNRIGVRADIRYFNHIDNVPSTWRIAAGVTLRLSQ